LLYDFVRDAYAIDTEYVNCFASFGAGNDFGTLYSGSSTSDGYVFAHSGKANLLSKRYKSEMDAGTYDDIYCLGTEDEPIVKLGWDCTIDGWLTELQTKNASITTLDDINLYLTNATIDRPDTSGIWTSPVYDVNASVFDKIYWNETLGTAGDATFQLRTAATTTDTLTAVWSTAVSNPSGSDISTTVTGARYMQVKSTLSTSNIDYTPELYQADGYVFKITYSKIGAAYETAVLSRYETGWKDFGVVGYQKLIKRIKVFYQGEAGTIDVNYHNEQGDINKTFTIDLSVNPSANINDHYTGIGDTKVYTYYPTLNTDTNPSAIGQLWKFSITENGTKEWSISKIEVEFNVENLY
jgi:hypothetical protein